MQSIGLVSWRLPGLITEAPSLARDLGADSLQVDYGGADRSHELRAGGSTVTTLKLEAARTNIPIATVALNALNDIGIPSKAPELRKRRDQILLRGLGAASFLEAESVLIPAFRRSAITSELELEETAAFLRQATALACGRGLTVAHENVLPPSSLRDLLASVPSVNLTVLFDIGNLIEHDIDPVEYLRQASARLHFEAHFKDFYEPPAGSVSLGNGTAPLREILPQLLSTTRLKTFVIETDHRESTPSGIASDIEWLKNLITEHNKGNK